jgi:hypothetical protein
MNLVLCIIQVQTGPNPLCTMTWHDDRALTWPLRVRSVLQLGKRWHLGPTTVKCYFRVHKLGFRYRLGPNMF